MVGRVASALNRLNAVVLCGGEQAMPYRVTFWLLQLVPDGKIVTNGVMILPVSESTTAVVSWPPPINNPFAQQQ
jgi:hypothetical protein